MNILKTNYTNVYSCVSWEITVLLNPKHSSAVLDRGPNEGNLKKKML